MEQMGFKEAAFVNQFMCAGGIQGYKRDSLAFQSVLPKVIECALQESCMSPPRSSKANHRYDQSAFSLVISSLGFTYVRPLPNMLTYIVLFTIARDHLLSPQKTVLFSCEKDRRFWNYHWIIPLTEDVTMQNDVVLNMRRSNGPYAKFLVQQPPPSFCNVFPAVCQEVTGQPKG